MIATRIVKSFTPVFFSAALLAACQKTTEKPYNELKSSTSPRTAKEKTVIVPLTVARRWKAVRIAIIDKVRGKENILVVPIGTLYKVPSSKLTIMVEYFIPAFTMEGATITSSSAELINPGAKVRISDNGTSVFSGWLFVKFPNAHAVTNPKYGFSLIGALPNPK